MAHRFGGRWTDDKLAALKAYLTQYRLIFTESPRAKFFRTIYVDAFAGTGDRKDSRAIATEEPNLPLIDEAPEPERDAYKAGSARIALSLDRPSINMYL